MRRAAAVAVAVVVIILVAVRYLQNLCLFPQCSDYRCQFVSLSNSYKHKEKSKVPSLPGRSWENKVTEERKRDE